MLQPGTEIRPRHYMARVLAGECSLQDCPEHYQAHVASLLDMAKASWVARILREHTRAARRAALARVPSPIQEEVKADVVRLWGRG